MNCLKLKPSWTKGGIGRRLEGINDEQRKWLIKANKQVPAGQSLIPNDRTYKQHLSHYQLQTKQMGINKCHGLRHAYAQRRYHELTKQFDPNKIGLLPPIQGGKASNLLSNIEKAIDLRARGIISLEMGHSRISIVKIYCG